jgi:hypothetical protein
MSKQALAEAAVTVPTTTVVEGGVVVVETWPTWWGRRWV